MTMRARDASLPQRHNSYGHIQGTKGHPRSSTVRRLMASLAVISVVTMTSAARVEGAPTIEVEIGLPSVEIPVGTARIPVTFSMVDGRHHDIAELPIEVGRPGRWRRQGIAMPHTIPPRTIKKASTATNQRTRGRAAFDDLSFVTYLTVTTTTPDQQIRIGYGVITPPILLRATAAATLPAANGKAPPIAPECASMVRSIIAGKFVVAPFLAFTTDGTQVLAAPVDSTQPGFCELLPANQLIILGDLMPDGSRNDRAHTWRSAIVHRAIARHR